MNIRFLTPQHTVRRFSPGLLALALPILLSNPARSVEARRTTPALNAAVSSRLVYGRKVGETRRYQVTGFFHGHIPPFANPGSEPINIKAVLQYAATVQKANPDGSAEVAFRVSKADLSVLAKEPGPDGKIDADDELPFPIAASDIHKALDVVATLRPDGSIVKITGGDSKNDKINLGFELRKLFLLTMPVTFPNRPLKPADSWRFDDGVLGKRPDYITYQAQLTAAPPATNSGAYAVAMNAENNVSDRKDKNGQTTTNDADATDTTTGKVTVKGTVQYFPDAANGTSKAAKNSASGRAVAVSQATLTMNALLHRKRTIADPDHPEAPLESDIDVRARLSVRALPTKTGK